MSTRAGGNLRHVMAWLLFAAYLPSLSFVGHWEPHFDIPGTDYYVGLPHGAGHDHDHSDHAQHCHANLGSCSDLPLVSTATVGLLARSVEQGNMEGKGLLRPGDSWSPHAAIAPSPELPPPRTA